MTELDRITEEILKKISGGEFKQEGAFNLRHNGIQLCHGDSEHVKIKKKRTRMELIFTLMEAPMGRKSAFR